jgi:N-succinyldiaminopimelate aminotransferase
MNRKLEALHAYPFSKLAELLSDEVVSADAAQKNLIALTVGEPQHEPPSVAIEALTAALGNINKYPGTHGELALREAIAQWLTRRYQLPVDAVNPETMVLPVIGTREALFAIAQTLVDEQTVDQIKVDGGLSDQDKPIVIVPSPFYQIYEGAALMAGAQPLYLPCTVDNNYLPDLDAVTEAQWQRCQLVYICNPSNPTGAIPTLAFYQRLLALADRYNFVIASDECYSEIYFNEAAPPIGLLAVCHSSGRDDFSRCLVFNSLSKRSNLAGMRSGFVAGDAALLKQFLLYRTYHGSAMPLHHQAASIAAWNDESHVINNRKLYREKMHAVVPILTKALPVEIPAAGFCLWAQTPIDDELFTRQLYREQHVKVLPGQYLARTVAQHNPGQHYVRMALVHPLEDCIEASHRIVSMLGG